eukprot:g30608.t1
MSRWQYVTILLSLHVALAICHHVIGDNTAGKHGGVLRPDWLTQVRLVLRLAMAPCTIQPSIGWHGVYTAAACLVRLTGCHGVYTAAACLVRLTGCHGVYTVAACLVRLTGCHGVYTAAACLVRLTGCHGVYTLLPVWSGLQAAIVCTPLLPVWSGLQAAMVCTPLLPVWSGLQAAMVCTPLLPVWSGLQAAMVCTPLLPVWSGLQAAMVCTPLLGVLWLTGCHGVYTAAGRVVAALLLVDCAVVPQWCRFFQVGCALVTRWCRFFFRWVVLWSLNGVVAAAALTAMALMVPRTPIAFRTSVLRPLSQILTLPLGLRRRMQRSVLVCVFWTVTVEVCIAPTAILLQFFTWLLRTRTAADFNDPLPRHGDAGATLVLVHGNGFTECEWTYIRVVLAIWFPNMRVVSVN